MIEKIGREIREERVVFSILFDLETRGGRIHWEGKLRKYAEVLLVSSTYQGNGNCMVQLILWSCTHSCHDHMILICSLMHDLDHFGDFSMLSYPILCVKV